MKLICQFNTIGIEELLNIIPEFIRKIKVVKLPKVSKWRITGSGCSDA